MKVCPILQIGKANGAPCLGDMCEWFDRGCPAHPGKTTTPAKKTKR